MKTLGDEATREEILARFSAVTGGDAARWGRMSVHGMLCHLHDSYLAALGEKAVSPATGAVQRTLVKWIALWAPVPWMKNLPTRPEVEQGRGGTPPGSFEADRAALCTALRRFCKEAGRTATPHPIFGPLKPAEWNRWGYLHADHHLRQFGR